MKIAALFAGIGGLESGLHQAGHKTVLTCEIWGPAVTVLAAKFPKTRNFPDVADLRGLPQTIDLLTAGFPCQDLSQAGTTAGIKGKRSGLVGHVFRLLNRRRVPIVVLENVPFMLQLDKGSAMDRLTRAFEELDYRWAYRTVNSLAFLPQRRERVFFVASHCDLDPAAVLFADDVTPPSLLTKLDTHGHGFYWTEGTRGLPSPPAILMPDGRIIKPDIKDAERLQGFQPNWTASAPERLRWSLVGNAVTVPVAAWLGQRLRRPGSYDSDRDRPWSAGTFPKAARYDGTRRLAVEIGSFPIWKKRPPLHRFLRFKGTLLSVRATAGFLSRAEASSLRFVPGFLDSVRAHLNNMRRDEDSLSTLTSSNTRRRKGKAPALIAAE